VLLQLVGDKSYELSNHLGNVLEVISDRKLSVNNGSGGVDFYTADVVSYSDYSPFGMVMPGRNGSAGDYRYGFQGQEKDDEIKGEGNSINYKYRMHDPRIGRFFAVDPLASSFPYNSPYAFSENVVISHVELEGLEKVRHEADANHEFYSWNPVYLISFLAARTAGHNFYESYLAATQPINSLSAAILVSTAGSVARELKFYGDDKDANEHGSLTNAYRHALGSAYLTLAFGAETAKMFTDAHEGGMNAYDTGHMNVLNENIANVIELNTTGQTILFVDVDGKQSVDSFVDQLNNRAGRLIALNNPNATTEELQLLILAAEKDGKLFQSETTIIDGREAYIITPTSLTNEQYETAKEEITKP